MWYCHGVFWKGFPPSKIILRWDCTLKFLSPKIFFLTNMQTWDHLDAKFVLILPPPLPCCFLWRFEVFAIWNFTYSNKISRQTKSFWYFFMIPTGFWPQERPLSCDGFRFCMEDHGTVPWLDIWSGFKIFVRNFFRFWWIPLKPGGIKKIGIHSPKDISFGDFVPKFHEVRLSPGGINWISVKWSKQDFSPPPLYPGHFSLHPWR